MNVARLFCVSIIVFSIGACVTKPPAVDPDGAISTHVSFNRANPPRVGFEYYPASSVHAREQGVCIVKMTVMADGAIKDIYVIQSTGYPALDEASVHAFTTGTLRPATENGHAIDDTVEIPVTWKITQVN